MFGEHASDSKPHQRLVLHPLRTPDDKCTRSEFRLGFGALQANIMVVVNMELRITGNLQACVREDVRCTSAGLMSNFYSTMRV